MGAGRRQESGSPEIGVAPERMAAAPARPARDTANVRRVTGMGCPDDGGGGSYASCGAGERCGIAAPYLWGRATRNHIAPATATGVELNTFSVPSPSRPPQQ